MCETCVCEYIGLKKRKKLYNIFSFLQPLDKPSMFINLKIC